MHIDEESIFEQALQRENARDRTNFLDRACANRPLLRAEIESLLNAYSKGEFLESPACANDATIDAPEILEGPGSQIGRYKLLEQIGEGGMGVVYMADQTDPVRRRVALKVIKPGMDTKQIIARFEAERQALAMMDHANIAKIHDAGATDSGRPFFVMELVRGVPITDYCDQYALDTKSRMELFIDVCRAVQHAHQKGVIHRDIKPTNVLVSRNDTASVAKVIDFGIAKATGAEIAGQTAVTGFKQLLGTPLYMSPEQAEMNNLDVDTRSDVYSLGVLLYELLTGHTPFDKRTFDAADYDELRRLIREVDPPRPSNRLSTLDAEKQSTLSSRRGVDVRELSRHLRGELDWIVMKCLEKDRNRRYESASALAADVERYLHNDPVEACPPSRRYLLGKFLRRRRTAVLMTATLLAAALPLVALAGWVVLDRATRQAETKRAVSLAWDEADRWEKLGRWTDALAAAKRGVDLLGEGNGDDELRDRARRRQDILQLLLRLEEIRLELAVESSPGIPSGAVADNLYAAAFRDYGLDVDTLEPEEVVQRMPEGAIRKELAGALDDWAVYRRSSRKRAKLTDDEPWQRILDAARAADPILEHNRLRDLWSQFAGQSVKEASTLTLDRLHPYSFRLLTNVVNLGEANRLLRAHQQRRPGDFWINWHLGTNLALVAALPGPGSPAQMDEASGYLRSALAARPDNPKVLAELGNALAHEARPEQTLDEGISYLERAVQSNSNIAMWQRYLGVALAKRGRLDDAAVAFQNAIRIAPLYPSHYVSLGEVFMRQRLWDEAGAAFAKAIQLNPNTKKKVAVIYNEYAWLLATTEQAELRDPRRALELAQTAVANDPSAGFIWNTLGVARYRDGNFPGAREALQKSIDLQSGGNGYDCLFLAMTHWQLGNMDEARTWYDKAARWRAGNASNNEELMRFQAEAAALLGLTPSSAEQAPESAGKIADSLE